MSASGTRAWAAEAAAHADAVVAVDRADPAERARAGARARVAGAVVLAVDVMIAPSSPSSAIVVGAVEPEAQLAAAACRPRGIRIR